MPAGRILAYFTQWVTTKTYKIAEFCLISIFLPSLQSRISVPLSFLPTFFRLFLSEKLFIEKFIRSVLVSVYCPFRVYMQFFLWIYVFWIKIEKKIPTQFYSEIYQLISFCWIFNNHCQPSGSSLLRPSILARLYGTEECGYTEADISRCSMTELFWKIS